MARGNPSISPTPNKGGPRSRSPTPNSPPRKKREIEKGSKRQPHSLSPLFLLVCFSWRGVSILFSPPPPSFGARDLTVEARPRFLSLLTTCCVYSTSCRLSFAPNVAFGLALRWWDFCPLCSWLNGLFRFLLPLQKERKPKGPKRGRGVGWGDAPGQCPLLFTKQSARGGWERAGGGWVCFFQWSERVSE